MYKSLVDVARQIVAIAFEREQNESQTTFSIADMASFNFDNKYDNQLTDILMNLQLDEVMALETIMYLGRDKDYNPELTADEIFLDYLNYIKMSVGYEKEPGIEQMVSKMPLGEYLVEGYAILGITL